MATDSFDDEVLDRLFEDFARRCRAGEQPLLEEYARDYPHLADAIREVFPALVAIEQFAPLGGESTDALGPKLDDRAVPKCLGEYQLIREVGRGGMGIVYEAIQESLGRRVAVKVLPPHPMMTASQLHRFQLEARTGAQLHHTHIVPVYGVGKQDGVHYYAMEFIEGEALDKVIHELRRVRESFEPQTTAPRSEVTKTIALAMMSGEFAKPQPPAAEQTSPGGLARRASGSNGQGDSMPVADPGRTTNGRSSATLSTRSDAPYHRDVALVGMHVAEALAYAHRHGVLHRDVKPSNLMLDTCGHVWVTDFGLAKVEGTAGVTRTGDAAGTLLYMAPERFDGRSEPTSDVYGLGATLYELLTLQPPFKDSSKVRLIDRIRKEEPKRPRQLHRRIPRDLETIVLKSMAKEPARRYQASEDVAEDLRRYLSDRPVQARRASAIERGWRWCRRNPIVAALSSAVFILLLTLVGVLYVMYGREAAGRQIAQDELEWLRVGDNRHFSVASSARAQKQPDVVLKFGVYDSAHPQEVRQDFESFLELLAGDIEKYFGQAARIDVRIFDGYDAFTTALAQGEIDFAQCGAVSYVKAWQQTKGISLLAMERYEGGEKKTGHIIVRKDSGIQSIEQLRGRRILFGEADSPIATVYFMRELAKARIDRNDLDDSRFNHDKKERKDMVARGIYDAFASSKTSTPAENDLVSIATFKVPNTVWVARAGLGTFEFKALWDCLRNFGERHRGSTALERLKVEGFVEAVHYDYREVEEAIRNAKKFLGK